MSFPFAGWSGVGPSVGSRVGQAPGVATAVTLGRAQRDGPEEWFNGPGGDFWVDFKPMDPEAVRVIPPRAR
jgi:hypothetical protein